jgi:hypothetical protein
MVSGLEKNHALEAGRDSDILRMKNLGQENGKAALLITAYNLRDQNVQTIF